MKSEKGITLIALVITVVLMGIIATAMISSGGNSLETVKLQNFNYEMQQVQGKVDAIHEKIKLGNEESLTLGQEITVSSDAVELLKKLKGINYAGMTDDQKEEYYYQDNFSYYRYFAESDVKNIFDISSNPGDMIINFQTREVISVNGFEYEGRTYYTLNDL